MQLKSIFVGVGENTIYSDQGRSLKFAELCYDLAKLFPPEKLQQLKYLLKCKFSVTFLLSLLLEILL